MPLTTPAPRRRPATSVAGVLSALLTEPGRPRVTWYGPGGERVELSGAVLDNWVSKTTNLLVEELDAGPGTLVRLDLPPHWRAVVWALAAWRAGATVCTAATPDADVVVSDDPAALGELDVPRGAGVVAVALPGLARRFDRDLPAGALDAAQAVMTYGDVIGWAPETEPDRAALDVPAVAHAALLAAADEAAAVPPGSRTLLTVGDDRSATAGTLLTVLGVLARDGSTVLLRTGPGTDAAARTERVVADERVTARA